MTTAEHSFSNLLVMGKSGAGKQPRIDALIKEFGLSQLSTGDLFRSCLKKFNEIEFEGDIEQFYDVCSESFLADDVIIKKLGPVAEWDDVEGVLLGLKAKYYVDSGKFVPDSITNAMFEKAFVDQGAKGLVLDGFPRTVAQAEFLMNLVINQSSNVDAIVLVDNEDEAIVQRTVGRRICPNCKKVYHIEYKPPIDGKICSACGTEVIQRSDDHEDQIRSRLNEFKTKAEPALEYLKNQGIPIAVVPGNIPVFTEEAVHESVMTSLNAALGSIQKK